MRKALCTVFLTCALSCPAIAQQQPSTAVPVGVAKAERKPVARAGDYVGRVEATGRVEIRARITGYLEEVLFKEGDLIKEGAPLYRIEKGLFQAQVEQAAGSQHVGPRHSVGAEAKRGNGGAIRSDKLHGYAQIRWSQPCSAI
jgi:membrane fusion protein, multidrug efflux system